MAGAGASATVMDAPGEDPGQLPVTHGADAASVALASQSREKQRDLLVLHLKLLCLAGTLQVGATRLQAPPVYGGRGGIAPATPTA